MGKPSAERRLADTEASAFLSRYPSTNGPFQTERVIG